MQAPIFLVLAIVAGSTLADDCQDELTKCENENNAEIQKFLGKGNPLTDFKTIMGDVCKVYLKANECFDSSDCNTDTGKNMKKEKKDAFFKTVEGGCNEDGSLNPCADTLLQCSMDYSEAIDYFKKEKVDEACAELITYDKCIAKANDKKSCPTSDIVDLVTDAEGLTKKARDAGCEIGCIKLFNECAFQLERADDTKEEFCKAYEASKACMENASTDANCQKEDPKTHLQASIKLRKSKMTEKDCDGATSVTVSAVLLMSAFVASFLGRQV